MSTPPPLRTRLPVWTIDVLAVVACAGAAFAAYAAVVRPRAAAAGAAALLAGQADEQEAALRQREAQLSSAQSREQHLKTLDVAAVKLQPPGRVNERLTRLADLAERVAADATPKGSLRIDQVTPLTAVRAARFYNVPIRLAGTATYSAATEFLHRLHAEFPDIAVAGLVINAGENAVEAARPTADKKGERKAPVTAVNATFSVDLVWYAALEGLSDAEGPLGEKKPGNP